MSQRRGLSVCQTTICNVFRGDRLPTQNALTSVLIGMGMTPKDPEFAAWREKRRELEAATVERTVLDSPHADETPLTAGKNGFTPLHKKRPPIPRQRPYNRQRHRYRRRDTQNNL